MLTGSNNAGKNHCLIMDEVDGMAGNEDRGGMQVRCSPNILWRSAKKRRSFDKNYLDDCLSHSSSYMLSNSKDSPY